MNALDPNLPLLKAGAALHWLVPFDKMPIAKGWSKAPVNTVDDLRNSARENANIGVRLGEWSKVQGGYLHLIDLDIRKPEMREAAWAALIALLPGARALPSVISGSGGESRHLYFITDKPFSKTSLAKSEGYEMVFDEKKGREVRKHDWEIDLFGTGSQAAIPPSIHPVTRKPYVWERPLDLDMPDLLPIAPLVPSAAVEAWGASSSDGPEIDDDDLMALVRMEPMDLTDEEVARYLADLPEIAVEDHDQWKDVGMALHHQYRGSEDGLNIWKEWSKQSTKYDKIDTERRWKSFSIKPNGIRMATIIQWASANRISHDLGIDDNGLDTPSKTSFEDFADLLDDEPAAVAIKKDTIDPDWVRKLHKNEEGEVKSTLPNVAAIVANDTRTHGIVAFNELKQTIVLRAEPKMKRAKRASANTPVNLSGPIWHVKDHLNGDTWTDSHDNAVRNLIETKSQSAGYGIKVTDRDLRGGIDLAAMERSFHPVKALIEPVQWDGKPRVETLFIDYLGTEDNAYYRQAALCTLVGAIARIYRPGHKFDFVPILEGVQGKGKSTFIEILGLHWYNELVGDISDPKQMIEVMQGSWILELGELSAMSRSDVNDLKAFVSRVKDKGRLAYAKRVGEYPRQCIFIGSTNDREYLKDQTGGRRFWPIVCNVEGQIDNVKLRKEIMQIWAEALHIYRQMEKEHEGRTLPLYLTDEAGNLAVEMQESRRVETAEEMLAGKIEAWLDQPIGVEFDDLDPDAPKIYRDETCVQQIWEDLLGRDGAIPHAESIKLGRAMQIVGWDRSHGRINSGEVNKKYGKCRVYTRPGK